MINTAFFELAVLTLTIASETDNKEDGTTAQSKWISVLNEASGYLDQAAQGTQALDLGSRLESRIALVISLVYRLSHADPCLYLL